MREMVNGEVTAGRRAGAGSGESGLSVSSGEDGGSADSGNGGVSA